MQGMTKAYLQLIPTHKIVIALIFYSNFDTVKHLYHIFLLITLAQISNIGTYLMAAWLNKES